MDYFGVDVNHAARIATLAMGGQVIISGTIYNEIKADIGANAMVTPLGEINLGMVRK